MKKFKILFLLLCITLVMTGCKGNNEEPVVETDVQNVEVETEADTEVDVEETENTEPVVEEQDPVIEVETEKTEKVEKLDKDVDPALTNKGTIEKAEKEEAKKQEEAKKPSTNTSQNKPSSNTNKDTNKSESNKKTENKEQTFNPPVSSVGGRPGGPVGEAGNLNNGVIESGDTDVDLKTGVSEDMGDFW